VSNISGKDAVGSLVAFLRGEADKNRYRRYRIRSVKRIDDYAMIKEVIRRRYKRAAGEGGKKPDLLLIDGGKGHLSSAVEELDSVGVDLPVISIAKKKEEVFVPGEMNPIDFGDASKAFRLVKKIRDEAHRFAISYHKKLRVKKVKKSLLDEISGVGEKRKKTLLTRFGSVESLRRASVKEIAETPLVSEFLAQRVHDFLQGRKDKTVRDIIV
jgi:excinuclease ABC subunit C